MLKDAVKIDPTTLKPDPLEQTRSPGGGKTRRKKRPPSPEAEEPAEQAPKDDGENPPHLLDVRV
jgi:hypothetical protein